MCDRGLPSERFRHFSRKTRVSATEGRASGTMFTGTVGQTGTAARMLQTPVETPTPGVESSFRSRCASRKQEDKPTDW